MLISSLLLGAPDRPLLFLFRQAQRELEHYESSFLDRRAEIERGERWW